jgi:hypothetical protein
VLLHAAATGSAGTISARTNIDPRQMRSIVFFLHIPNHILILDNYPWKGQRQSGELSCA